MKQTESLSGGSNSEKKLGKLSEPKLCNFIGYHN